jgi:hypothetical protein
LEKIFAEFAHDPSVKVVVLTGTGKGFCSGGRVDDIIGPLLKMKGDELYKFTRMTCNVVKNMRNLKKPIIAAVNGIAAGAVPADAGIRSADFPTRRVPPFFIKVGLSAPAGASPCRGSSARQNHRARFLRRHRRWEAHRIGWPIAW